MKAYILIASFLVMTAAGACRKCEKTIPTPQPINWTNKVPELHTHNEAKMTISQGVAGTLTYKEGNCMPVFDAENTSCKEYPVKGTIRIYQYTLEKDVVRDTEHNIINISTQLVATAQTDAEGFFQVNLSPGQYSLVMEYKGKLYNFMSDGAGGLQPFTVTANTVIKENARIDKAVY